jgi:hypothetical protein
MNSTLYEIVWVRSASLLFKALHKGRPELGRGEALIHLQVSEGENRASDLRRAGK